MPGLTFNSACPVRPRGLVLCFLLLAAAALGGCGSRQQLRPGDIRPLPHASITRVAGLREAMQRAGSNPVRVLVVHGMRTHQAGYSEVMQRGLAQRLGLVEAAGGSPIEAEIVRGYGITVRSGRQPQEGVPVPHSQVRRYAWAHPATPDQERVVFYEVLWAPLRDNVKSHFLACFETGEGSPAGHSCPDYDGARRNLDHRAVGNRALKNHVLVGGFGDATIVLGPLGDVLRDDVTLAACMLAKDVLMGERVAFAQAQARGRCDLADSVAQPAELVQAAARRLQQTEFFTITLSLGSFLVMDAQRLFAQDRADPDSAERAEAERENLAFHLFDDATVFMLANQVSLLHLGRLQAICEPAGGAAECPNRVLPTAEDWMSEGEPLSQLTTYVAFNDTDDLLGFELPWYLPREGLFGPLVNVSVRNRAPRYLGLFEDPRTHVRHELNRAVIEAIADGFDVPRPAPAAAPNDGAGAP
jgi:hypothetical protein